VRHDGLEQELIPGHGTEIRPPPRQLLTLRAGQQRRTRAAKCCSRHDRDLALTRERQYVGFCCPVANRVVRPQEVDWYLRDYWSS
jgi:hypothetical protein